MSDGHRRHDLYVVDTQGARIVVVAVRRTRRRESVHTAV